MKSASARGKVIAVVLLACVVPSLINLSLYFLLGGTRHVQETIHEGLELSGSWIALTVATLVWLRTQHEPGFSHLTWVVAALAGMGLVDGLHALVPFGVAWSWLRHSATLLGGLLFALVWLPLPAYTLRRRRFLILTVIALAIAGSLAIWHYPGWLPVPFGPAGYSFATKAANVLGGLGFLAASLFFVRRYLCQFASEDLVFASHTLLFATAGLLFGFSHLWAADWWVWHGFRLLAYGIVLMAAYEVVVNLYQEIALHAQELENHVRSRTAELRRLAAIVESSDDAIISKSLDGVITTWNEGAARLYGYTAAEAVGQPMALIVPPELNQEVQVLLKRILQGESVLHHETVRLHKDGSRIDVSVTLSAVRDIHGEVIGASAIARDITEHKRVEQEINDLNSSLERRVSERTADLLAANRELESFDYSIAHDLRAPLRHLDGYSKILLEECGMALSGEARRCAERIRDGARRMGRMVDELLQLSRTSRCELSKEVTGMRSLVADVLEELGPELKGREIEWRVGDLSFAECDPRLIHQVFANLLSNAVKFTRHRQRAVIEVGETTSRGQTVLFVRDNGVGFNMKYADKLFGVFQRLHRREDFEGTGIGLATVQRIVHKHGGRIWAEAEVDKGATLYFTLGPGLSKLEQPNPEPITAFVGER